MADTSVCVERVRGKMLFCRCTKTGPGVRRLGNFGVLGKNDIILKIRRSSGKSFYILEVSKWAIFERNLRNFHLTDEKISQLQTKVYENWATHCTSKN